MSGQSLLTAALSDTLLRRGLDCTEAEEFPPGTRRFMGHGLKDGLFLKSMDGDCTCLTASWVEHP
jgi:hypothetical protein